VTDVTVIGLMSGTSVDAVDAATVAFRREGDRLGLRLLAYVETPYPPELHGRIVALLPPAQGSTADVCELNALVGEVFAEAARASAAAAGLPLSDVDLVASHGQTVYHQVAAGRPRSTLQIGAPAVIAERTGRTVAADFRPRDVAAGGQGAPLLPLLDALLCGGGARPRVLQNIGGIANLTWLPAAGAAPERGGDVTGAIAFDTGPGNCLIDEVARALSGGRLHFDEDGAWAAAGTPDERLLALWLEDPYFALPPPKSTGRERFGRDYALRLIEEARGRGLGDADTLATVTALTARSIALACRRWLPSAPAEMLVSGGGMRNRTLMGMLAAALPETSVRPFDGTGIPGAAKEAVGFALLGYYTLHGWPGSLPGCTGAAHATVLGSLTPGGNYRDLMRRVLADASGPPSRAVVL